MRQWGGRDQAWESGLPGFFGTHQPPLSQYPFRSINGTSTPDPSGFGDLDAFPPQNCKNLMFQFIHDRTPRIRDPARLLMFRRSFRVIIDIVFDPPELVARGCKCLCQTGFAAVLRIPLTDVLRRPFRIWFKFHNQYGFLRRFVLVCHASCLPSFPKNRFPLGRAQPALPYGKIKL